MDPQFMSLRFKVKLISKELCPFLARISRHWKCGKYVTINACDSGESK